MTFLLRKMTRADVPACLKIINHIIAQGGSTAHEDPFDETTLGDHYIDKAATANVAVHGDRVVGFQSTFEVEQGLFSVGTFTDRTAPIRGAGKALMAATKAECRALGGHAIIAKITSDNAGGLAFYAKMGFEDDAIITQDFTRKDGTVVDRVIKRFSL